MSVLKPEVKVKKEEILATRKIKVDLSDAKPKQPAHLVAKKQHKPQWFCHFCGKAGYACPNCLHASKQAT